MFKKIIAQIGLVSVVGSSLLIAVPAFAQVQVGVGEYDQVTTGAANSLGATISGSNSVSGNAATTNINDTAAVNTNAALITDTNVKEVSTSSQSVSMSYPTHAKLFGFIPVVVTAKAEVQSNGVVHVQYPWYSIFMSTDGTALQAKLQATANAILLIGTTSAAASGNATLTTDDQATLIDELHAVLQNNFSGSAQASATAAAY